ncbi:hypothetical protein DTO217A2_673 [Paecilomyces variotii]|nr:hypothetical protein DTO217A2_673 [Paecilomyces variotii]
MGFVIDKRPAPRVQPHETAAATFNGEFQATLKPHIVRCNTVKYHYLQEIRSLTDSRHTPDSLKQVDLLFATE